MSNEKIIIYNDPLMGLFTLQDLINYLNLLIKENKDNLEILEGICSNTELDKSDIVTITNKFDMTNNLKFIVDLLSNRI